jgi:THO complex subunit 1
MQGKGWCPAAYTHFLKPPAGLRPGHLLSQSLLQVYTALAKTEDGGEEFASAVKHVLAHESHWVAWKNAGCPPFDRPPAPPLDVAPAGAAQGEGMGPGPATKRR